MGISAPRRIGRSSTGPSYCDPGRSCRPPSRQENLPDGWAGARPPAGEEGDTGMSNYQAPLNWPGGGNDTDVDETEEWLTAFEQVVEREGRNRACFLLQKLLEKGYEKDVVLPFTGNTPYINTIPKSEEPPYAGNRALERRIKSIVRWNAMALVVRANKKYPGLGGHISTFASSATLYQVGFHHFFRGRGEGGFDGDIIYFQGHASPGIYAHAFLEGRITLEQMEAFR